MRSFLQSVSHFILSRFYHKKKGKGDFNFNGGIYPPEMKRQSSEAPLRQIPLPSRIILPLKQHPGDRGGELCVQPGDNVLRGQPLVMGRFLGEDNEDIPWIHAPTSGIVEYIGPHVVAHPSGLTETCIFIVPDGEDRWIDLKPIEDYRTLTPNTLIPFLHKSGIVGLGGAGFPTGRKLKGMINNGGNFEEKLLIINAAECEPYITADDRLIRERAHEIIQGCHILRWVLQISRVLIGIEENKAEAIVALRHACGTASHIELCIVPTKYPSGSARHLVKLMTGKEVPKGKHLAEIGLLMLNVGTAFSIKRAIVDGEPLTERVVTLTGEAVKEPGNVWGRLGTPVRHLLQYVGVTSDPLVVMGGPLMGFKLPSLDAPIVKTSNCLLTSVSPLDISSADSSEKMRKNISPEGPCIRCGACSDVCPVNLLPQQLYWYSRGGEHEKTKAYHIADCIECAACDYVCPADIPLVQYFRKEKAELRARDQEAQSAVNAKKRFEARQARLAREKSLREARLAENRLVPKNEEKTQIAAALARVRAKKANQQQKKQEE